MFLEGSSSGTSEMSNRLLGQMDGKRLLTGEATGEAQPTLEAQPTAVSRDEGGRLRIIRVREGHKPPMGVSSNQSDGRMEAREIRDSISDEVLARCRESCRPFLGQGKLVGAGMKSVGFRGAVKGGAHPDHGRASDFVRELHGLRGERF